MNKRVRHEVQQVLNGYTISVGKRAAFGRVGGRFVMRDRSGRREEYVAGRTTPAELLNAWDAFRTAALGHAAYRLHVEHGFQALAA